MVFYAIMFTKTGEYIMMNTKQADILYSIIEEPFFNQRSLAEVTGYSLGTVNQTVKALINDGYLTEELLPTQRGREEYAAGIPRNAIILAAGFGMRMAPINLSAPKGLLEVNKEPLIERQIRQLHEAGIKDITIVVGFLKESFDYLIDEYGVKLVYNAAYAKKNNLHSLALAADRISDTYILPSDIWCRNNLFRKHEPYSWYMVTDEQVRESEVRISRKKELVRVRDREPGSRMTEIAYIRKEDAGKIRERLLQMDASGEYDGSFWEAVLFENGKMCVPARLVSSSDIVEINTYEQLRDLDSGSYQLKSHAIDTIAEVFHTTPDQITDIAVLKKGMTNRSFIFTWNKAKYIMRIPGEGTDQLIDRHHEAQVYRAISGFNICDDPVYLSPENGYKITKFLQGVRTADPEDQRDLEKCMKKLRSFHELGIKVDHTFDLFGQIRFYESLWNGRKSIYRDYLQTRENVFSLQELIGREEKNWTLTHIDAVPDNFLFYEEDGEEKLQLTDWEYAGMQDPHLDIAMFCVYSCYSSKEQVDRLIDLYFAGACDSNTRRKIYCYIAAAGLLWSNWCEYKAILGVEFGEYALRQYRFAKEYYRYAMGPEKQD